MPGSTCVSTEAHPGESSQQKNVNKIKDITNFGA
jgi:hypothetical protein